MVILCVAICDKIGKLLLSRQFQEFTKQQLEEKIQNFPKQISSQQQHTFVEFSNIRYVYMPLNNFYLLLLTNKNSNIIEDLETLKLVHNIVITLCPSDLNEESLMENQFEILLMIDDILTSYGLRINTTITQLQTSLEMESAEEKLAIMQKKAQENQAKEDAQKHTLEVQKKMAEGKQGGVSTYMGISGGTPQKKSNEKQSSNQSDKKSTQVVNEFDSKVGELEKVQPENNFRETVIIKESQVSNVAKQTNAPKKSLVLGKKKVNQ